MFEKIILSLAIGALIGIEREWRAKKNREVFAGVRTFMLICLFGVLTPYIAQLVSSVWFVYVGMAAVAGMVLISYYINFKKFGSVGLTTEIAFFLTYIIGMLLFFEAQPYFISISLGIILTLILFSLEPLHKFAHKRSKKEVRDAIIFAALVFIVLPLLPKAPIDPYGAINPYLVWLSMVVVMSVSFAGYVAMKLLGRRGLGLTGFFGGLASSTSVTISMAGMAKRNKKIVKSAVFAIIIASSTMFFRMLLVVSFFDYAIAFALLPVLAVLGVVGYAMSYITWKKIGRTRTAIKLTSPISFKPIFQFMVIFVAVMFASHMAKLYFPSAIYPIAALSGIFDVDAITISLASLSAVPNGMPLSTAINAIIIAALSNTLSKMLLARWIGGKKIWKEIKKAFVPLLVAGIIVFIFQLFLV